MAGGSETSPPVLNTNKGEAHDLALELSEEILMDSTKSLFASKTFWGAVVAAVAPILIPHLHLSTDAVNSIATQLVTLSGAALAIYGRVKAEKSVTITGK